VKEKGHRYLVFSGFVDCPKGGADDFVFSSDDFDEIKSFVLEFKKSNGRDKFIHVFDNYDHDAMFSF